MRTRHLPATLGSAAILLVVGVGMAGHAWAETDELERRIERLENILDSDQLVELIQQINELEEQVRELRGAIEEQGHALDQLRQRQRNLYGDLDQRLRAMEVDERETAAVAPQTVEQSIDEPAPDAGQSEREAYEAAFGLLREGRYGESAEAFQEFLRNHPDGSYAANARYWIGETHYVSREFDSALQAFTSVVENHPDSSKRPDAMLKIGYSLYELERYEDARDVLDRVRDEFQGSSVARLAEDRLDRMREEGL